MSGRFGNRITGGPFTIAASSTKPGSGQIDSITQFADTIRPVQIVATPAGLPASASQGDFAVISTGDERGQLYLYDNGAWVDAVPAVSIRGQLTNAQLAEIAAAKISGQLSDSQLAAIASSKVTGQIVASQMLLLPDGGNICPDPSFKDEAFWSRVKQDWVFVTRAAGNTAETMDVLKCVQLTGAIAADRAIESQRISYSGVGNILRLRCKTYNTSNQVLNVFVRFTDAAYASLGYLPVASLAGAGLESKTAQGTVPANTKHIELVIRNDYVATPMTGTQAVADIRLENAIDTGLLTARSIVAGHVALGTLTGAEIAATTITGNNIAATTITGAKIAGTTITGDKIVGSTITGDKIAATTITGAKIAANSIESHHILAGQILAEHLTADCVTAGAIQAGAVGASEISVANLSAINADLGTVTAGKARAVSIEDSAGNVILTTSSRGSAHLSCANVSITTSTGNSISADRTISTSSDVSAGGNVGASGYVHAVGGLYTGAAGLKVVGTQQAHIANADGTLADLTTKFNTLLSALEAHGLLASS